MSKTKTEITILSIDAWRNGDGWDWNQWFKVGSVEADKLESLKTPRQILKYMRQMGFLTAQSAGKCAIDDDQYNLVVVDRINRMPLFAIAYGEAT